MKFLLLLILVSTQLFALSITLNSAKDNNSEYAVLHLQDIEPINCQSIPQSLNKVVYLCQFKKIVKVPLNAKNMKLVEIDFLEKKKEFFIKIAPKVESQLIPVKSTLFQNQEVSDKDVKKVYKHWSILLYEKNPFPLAKPNDGIDFPVIFPKEEKPYIGALDLNGAPISYAQSKDISLYLDLKKSFAKKDYKSVIEDSVRIIKQYPNTIFKGELLLYRVKALDLILNEENNSFADNFDRSDVTKEAKEWVRAFPSNENLPETLMILAQSYLFMGQRSDANYFLDILISEHEDSKFTKKAILKFADSMYNSRQKDRAMKLYKDVLYSARDLDVAAEAAIRLVDKEVARGKKQEAREYLLKVLGANQQYLLKDKQDTYRLAEKLVENGLFDVAGELADVLLSDVKRGDENRERLFRDVGIWYAKAHEVTKAYDRLKNYLKEYKNGEFTQEVQEAIDALFFELNETNQTKLVKYYDELIDKYQNSIGDKAVVEKAKLLLSQQKYEDVLKMQDILLRVSDDNNTEINEIVNEAASALTNKNIQTDDCLEVVKFIEDYKLSNSKFEATKIFQCLIRTSRFINAKDLSERKIKSKNLKEKMLWLENYVISLYKLNQFSKVIEVGDDVLKLSASLKQKASYDALKYIFFSYLRKNNLDKALEIAKTIAKERQGDLRNSDIYNAIVREATFSQDDLLLSEYAKKVIELQEKYKKYVQTPSVEFSYINALKRLNRDKEALKVAQKLVTQKIEAKELTKAYYYIAEISLKLDDLKTAKDYFQKCSEAKEKSSWQDICKQNLKLLE